MSGAYLDHAATTPMRPEAVAAMAPLLGEVFGNPSGSHRWAREARRQLDDARDVVAELVGARPAEVVFTSGGTEADNLAVTGVLAATGGRALCSAVEHHAVLEPVRASGGHVVAVDAAGRLDVEQLATALRTGPTTSVVSAMTANNELGTVQSIDAIAAVVTEASPGTVLHTDAVAAAAWLDLAHHTRAAQLVSLSGHKVGGPKGIGVLVVREGTPLAPLLRGGGQEHERRSGTPNVAGAVGLAAAVLAAGAAERTAMTARVEALRRRLVDGLQAAVPDVLVVSPAAPAERTPGTVQLCFAGVEREALLFLLDQAGIAASWGSSCASGATEPSHVLAAVGVAPAAAAGALRLSLGWCSTDADVDAALTAVPAAVARLRGPSWAPTDGASAARSSSSLTGSGR